MTARKKKVKEVEATVIDAPDVLSGADRWLAEQRAKVKGIAEDYQPHEIESAQDYRDSKRARTQARKAIKEVEDARRAQVGAIKDAVRDFEAQVRDLLAPLSGVDASYKEALAEWERLTVESRTQAIEAWYVDQGGVVVDAVPFQRLVDAFGAEGKWLNYGTNEVAIQEDVTRRVRAIEADLESIDAQSLDEGERMALKQDYLSTLDMGEAMRRAAERRRQREALEEAERRRQEAERAERERLEREEAERAAAEAERRAREETEHEARLREAEEARLRRAEAGMEPAAPGDAPMAPEAAPAPEFAPFAPAPDPVEAPPAPAPDTAPQAPAAPPAPTFSEPGEATAPWVVVVEAATRSQMELVAKAIGSLGVRGRVLPGTLAQALDRTRG